MLSLKNSAPWVIVIGLLVIIYFMWRSDDCKPITLTVTKTDTLTITETKVLEKTERVEIPVDSARIANIRKYYLSQIEELKEKLNSQSPDSLPVYVFSGDTIISDFKVRYRATSLLPLIDFSLNVKPVHANYLLLKYTHIGSVNAVGVGLSIRGFYGGYLYDPFMDKHGFEIGYKVRF